MKLRELDLNLLVVLRELLVHGTASKAAESLQMSQPAVSNALNRLRKTLGDELFTRTSRGLVPTRMAEDLREPLDCALQIIIDSLNRLPTFDPKASSRNFKIVLTDVGETYFLPALMTLLSRASPGVSITCMRNTTINLREEMEAGRVDLALGVVPEVEVGFFQRTLLTTRYVCLLRREHPFANPCLTLEQFLSADHINVTAEGTAHANVEAVLQRLRIRRNVKIDVPHFVAVGHILLATDMIAVVPEAYAARTFERAALTTASCPFEIPDLSVNLLWHAQNHNDAGNRWLRDLIHEQFSSFNLIL